MTKHILVIAALALIGCGKSGKQKVEEAEAKCGPLDQGIKICQAEFDKAWAKNAKSDNKYYESTCRGESVGYGLEHPAWLEQLDKCARMDLKDCNAFADCASKLLNFKGFN